MANSMKAETPDAMSCRQLSWNSIVVRIRRESAMEPGVGDDDNRNGPDPCADRFYRGNRRRIVKGGKLRCLLEIMHYFAGRDCRLGHALAAMNNAMRNCVNRVTGLFQPIKCA